VPGIEIEGTLTELGTGTPIVGLSPPHSVPAICALNPTTQARVKCATVESGGKYSIAGLPAGTYAVSFAEDWVEDGLDLHPDGYVRRYWEEVPSFGESTLLAGTAGAVFPNCEVPSACPPPPSSGETSSSGSGIAPTTTTLPQARPATATQPLIRRPRCKKGFRHVVKGGRPRCIKISRGHGHR
jgi:hypothetical protein